MNQVLVHTVEDWTDLQTNRINTKTQPPFLRWNSGNANQESCHQITTN